jgi:hypothetical protein
LYKRGDEHLKDWELSADEYQMVVLYKCVQDDDPDVIDSSMNALMREIKLNEFYKVFGSVNPKRKAVGGCDDRILNAALQEILLGREYTLQIGEDVIRTIKACNYVVAVSLSFYLLLMRFTFRVSLLLSQPKSISRFNFPLLLSCN